MSVGQTVPCGHFICSLFLIEVADKDDWETRGSIVFHSQQAMTCTVVRGSVKPSSFSEYCVWFVILQHCQSGGSVLKQREYHFHVLKLNNSIY